MTPVYIKPGSFTKIEAEAQRSIHKAKKKEKMEELGNAGSKIPTKTFGRSAVLCFTETWLSEHIPVFQGGDSVEVSGKMKQGRMCLH